MSIQDLLLSPESKTLEFKETMPTPLAIAKTACASSNAGGGTILIGVEDKNKTITGIDEQEIHTLEEKIANIGLSAVLYGELNIYNTKETIHERSILNI